jgi:DNA polymerase
MLVGEGPGAEEDRQGLPFVGRAGKLLDDAMGEAGLDPNRDFLITNLVKCRPPDNRVPRAEEVEACRPFLLRQIELLHPRILVLLGRTAAKYLLSRQAMEGAFSKKVGGFFENADIPGIEMFLLFHPAYILRNRRMKPEMVRHLVTLRNHL